MIDILFLYFRWTEIKIWKHHCEAGNCSSRRARRRARWELTSRRLLLALDELRAMGRQPSSGYMSRRAGRRARLELTSWRLLGELLAMGRWPASGYCSRRRARLELKLPAQELDELYGLLLDGDRTSRHKSWTIGRAGDYVNRSDELVIDRSDRI